jgi:predicted MPP superfamily phosphohydrolase
LSAKHGVFVSMGNHDYFGEGEPLISLIRERGVTVLRNEGLRIEHDGAALYLAAIDDTWTKRDDMGRALAERPEGMPCVLMCHDPERFPQAAKMKVDVVLSGHTHGGQVGMPFLAHHINFSRIAHHYNLGIYKKGKSTLYVHPGLGVTGPPIRLGIAPAITIITLRCSSQSGLTRRG